MVSKFSSIIAAPPILPKGEGNGEDCLVDYIIFFNSCNLPAGRFVSIRVIRFNSCNSFSYFFFLNISSILSVTTNPPTTFNVPNITAKKPSDNAK
jgi:hypothetical protein